MGIPNVRFAAVCDIWDYSRNIAQKLLKNYGHDARGYADYREMLGKEKSLHAVIVATPDFIHAEQTNACLKAGLHVYCEKMMANSLDAARSMTRTARETGKLLQIGYERRAIPAICTLSRNCWARRNCRTAHARGRAMEPSRRRGRGLARKFAVADDVLRRYGYADMHEFRNWRVCGNMAAGRWPISAPPDRRFQLVPRPDAQDGAGGRRHRLLQEPPVARQRHGRAGI